MVSVGHGGVRVLHRSRGTGAKRTQPSWPQMDRYQQRWRRSPTLPLAFGVYGKAPQRVETIFSATPPLEILRVPLCVACQEDVFRVEDPFLVSIADVSRDHFYADAVRDVCQTKTPKQSSQPCVGNCERQSIRIPGCSTTVGRALRSVLGDWRIFPRRGISVPFFPHRLGDVHSGARR